MDITVPMVRTWVKDHDLKVDELRAGCNAYGVEFNSSTLKFDLRTRLIAKLDSFGDDPTPSEWAPKGLLDAQAVLATLPEEQHDNEPAPTPEPVPAPASTPASIAERVHRLPDDVATARAAMPPATQTTSITTPNGVARWFDENESATVEEAEARLEEYRRWAINNVPNENSSRLIEPARAEIMRIQQEREARKNAQADRPPGRTDPMPSPVRKRLEDYPDLQPRDVELAILRDREITEENREELLNQLGRRELERPRTDPDPIKPPPNNKPATETSPAKGGGFWALAWFPWPRRGGGPNATAAVNQEVYVNNGGGLGWLAALAALAFLLLVWPGINGEPVWDWGDNMSTNTTNNPSNSATATPAPQQVATTPAATGGGTNGTGSGSTTGTMPALTKDTSHGKWTIKQNADIDKDPIVRDWIARLKDPDPYRWRTYPNIPNPDVPEFRVVKGTQVPDGVEYGVDNVPFCQQDQRCDFIVPALHYRLITADYEFLGQSCRGDGQKGCLLLLINVMDASYTFRNQIADNGFTVAGRFWNGDALEWGTWGLVSHASANMLNLPTMASPDKVLNAGAAGANGGANCGNPKGCGTVDVRVVVIAGDRILAEARSIVTR